MASRPRWILLSVSCIAAALDGQALCYAAGPVHLAPAGALSHYLSAGWGGRASFTRQRGDGPLGLRVEASYVSFPFAAADHADLRTTAQVPVLVNMGGSRLTVLAGPELSARLGPVRTAAGARAGAVGAFSVMSLTGLGSDDRYSRRKRFSDLAPALQADIALGFPVGRGISLELAAAFGALGPTSYGLNETIRVGVISGPYWSPLKRWSQYAAYSVGVVFGARS